MLSYFLKMLYGHKRNSGFTLIEMLVVVGILTFTMGIIVVKQSSFNSSILLTNLAYKVALSVREAQVYGLAVAESQEGGSTFGVGYGLHFEESTPDQYILFADLNNNRMFDTDEELERFQLNRNNVIGDFCATPANGVEDCSITFLDIVFERPNPDAYFTTNVGNMYGNSRVVILSPRGDTREVGVMLTGQITVRKESTTELPSQDDLPDPGTFQQGSGSDGIVSIEAEDFDINTPQGSHTWQVLSEAGASGGIAMEATPNDGTNNNTGYITNSPRLNFEVEFIKTGTHYVWIRAWARSGNDDSFHAGLDGAIVSSADRIQGFSFSATPLWSWSKATRDGVDATIIIPSTGPHTLNIWMREDGSIIDKIVLTTNPSFTPSGTGP